MADDWQKAAKAASEAALRDISQAPATGPAGAFPFSWRDVNDSFYPKENPAVGGILDAALDRGLPEAEDLAEKLGKSPGIIYDETVDAARRAALAGEGVRLRDAPPMEYLRSFSDYHSPEKQVSSVLAERSIPPYLYPPGFSPTDHAESLVTQASLADAEARKDTYMYERGAAQAFIGKHWDKYGAAARAAFPNIPVDELQRRFAQTLEYIQELKRVAGPAATTLLKYLNQYGLMATDFLMLPDEMIEEIMQGGAYEGGPGTDPA